MGYVLVCIVGHGERSIDQAMVVAKKGYGKEDVDWMLNQAREMGVDGPEIIGETDLPEQP